MSKTDHVSAALVKWMDRAFNDDDAPPAGGVSGGCQLRPGMGLPALDNFDDCVLAWVMAGQRGKTEAFPTMMDYTECQGRPVWEFSVGIARCSTALGEGGYLPTVEEMESEYAIQEDDKDRLEAATCRAVAELKNDNRLLNVALGPIEVYGPAGATVAVFRTVMIEPVKGRMAP